MDKVEKTKKFRTKASEKTKNKKDRAFAKKAEEARNYIFSLYTLLKLLVIKSFQAIAQFYTFNIIS
ncbi:hypothetical protein GCM10027085_58450 [Spirosoma aerophilum]